MDKQQARIKLENLAWTHSHKNSRGKTQDGVRTLLAYISDKGTCVVYMSHFTIEELCKKIPKAVKEKKAYQEIMRVLGE